MIEKTLLGDVLLDLANRLNQAQDSLEQEQYLRKSDQERIAKAEFELKRALETATVRLNKTLELEAELTEYKKRAVDIATEKIKEATRKFKKK
jgi:hypothetical protein